MKLSEFIEELQSELNRYGDAEVYHLGECGKENVGYLDHANKIIEDSYYDCEKDEFHDAKYAVDYYYLV